MRSGKWFCRKKWQICNARCSSSCTARDASKLTNLRSHQEVQCNNYHPAYPSKTKLVASDLLPAMLMHFRLLEAGEPFTTKENLGRDLAL